MLFPRLMTRALMQTVSMIGVISTLLVFPQFCSSDTLTYLTQLPSHCVRDERCRLPQCILHHVMTWCRFPRRILHCAMRRCRFPWCIPHHAMRQCRFPWRVPHCATRRCRFPWCIPHHAITWCRFPQHVPHCVNCYIPSNSWDTTLIKALHGTQAGWKIGF